MALLLSSRDLSRLLLAQVLGIASLSLPYLVGPARIMTTPCPNKDWLSRTWRDSIFGNETKVRAINSSPKPEP